MAVIVRPFQIQCNGNHFGWHDTKSAAQAVFDMYASDRPTNTYTWALLHEGQVIQTKVSGKKGQGK